jgi:hypothetical protein
MRPYMNGEKILTYNSSLPISEDSKQNRMNVPQVEQLESASTGTRKMVVGSLKKYPPQWEARTELMSES